MGARKKILILGGTGEARRLAARLVAEGHDVTSSLAGRTSTPILPEGTVRIGGFGGAEGLSAYLREGGFSHLIDATHPFATQISANAVAASEQTGVPMIRLERPPWSQPDGTDWIAVETISEAAATLPHGAVVLLTVGRQEASMFFARTDCHFVARAIESPEAAPERWVMLSARGPFSVEGEIALMRAHKISHLVSKNSGGDQTAAKLEAAAELGIRVVMVRRPVLPDAPTAANIEEVLKLLSST